MLALLKKSMFVVRVDEIVPTQIETAKCGEVCQKRKNSATLCKVRGGRPGSGKVAQFPTQELSTIPKIAQIVEKREKCLVTCDRTG